MIKVFDAENRENERLIGANGEPSETHQGDLDSAGKSVMSTEPLTYMPLGFYGIYKNDLFFFM